MIHIKKNAEPEELSWYKKQEGACFDDMDAEVKEQLRESLLQEQGHLCAYCMCSLTAENGIKIEHFHARTKENELDYHNLFAVCKGNEGQPKRLQTCDTRKANEPLTVNPLKERDMATIYYGRNGEIHSSNPKMDQDIEDKLNLNCREGYLIENRKAVLEAVNEELYKLKSGQEAKTLLLKLKKYYARHRDYMHEYVGIMRWYIDKRLKRYGIK